MKPALDPAAGKAAELFRIVEDLGVRCGYERSFKMLQGRLLANRFLLAINSSDLTPGQLLDVCRRLDMPARYADAFQAHLADANTVFLGFEDNEPDCLYKVYLEFWEKVKSDLRGKSAPHEPMLLHLGFKWNTDDNARGAVSRYLCHPMLEVESVLQRLSDVYHGDEDNASLRIAQDLLALAAARSRGGSFIYVEVSEEGSPRKSFDINLYKAGLRLREIASWLSRMRDHYSIPAQRFDRLYQLVGDRLFGHLAGGLGRDGKDFLTVYYEM